MQQTLDGIPAQSTPRRFRLPDLWELTRRLSGIAAIAILGVAMLILAFRTEDTTQPQQIAVAAEQPAPAQQTQPADNAWQATYIPPTTAVQLGTETEPIVVYYLYATPEQYQDILMAEAVAGTENANAVIGTSNRQFYAMDARTPEGEQIARDTIFEAMLQNGANARVIVHDLR